MSRRSLRRVGLLSLILGLLSLLWLVPLAAAKITHEKRSSFPLAGLSSLSIDDSSGADFGLLYVGEYATESSQSRVYQADPGGVPTGVELNGAETPAGSFGLLDFSSARVAGPPAVDSSNGPNSGDIYVVDALHAVIDRFAPSGAYLCQITGATTPSPSECAGSAGSETPGPGLAPISVAVNPSSGAVAVGDAGGALFEFDAAGGYQGEIADSHIEHPGSLAFDSTGALYLVNESPFAGPGDALKFSPAGAFVSVLASGRSSVGVDLENDHVYLGAPEGPTAELDSAGNDVSSFGSGAFSLAVARGTQRVYANPLFAEGQIWSGDLFAPEVLSDPATAIDETEATLTGRLDPEISAGGTPVGTCSFEYGIDEGYGEEASCAPAPPFTTPAEVSAALSALAPATTYHFRLRAANSEAVGLGADQTFTTRGPPQISAEQAIARTTSATLRAEIDPFGYQTSCAVQYVGESAFQASGFTTAQTVPCDSAIAPGFSPAPVSARLTGLQVGASYRYRFLATNQAASVSGEELSFSTFSIESFSVQTLGEDGLPETQAGAHPYGLRVDISLTKTSALSPRNPASAAANLKSVRVSLPPGLIGNPTAAPSCPPYAMKATNCSPASQVGNALVSSPRGAEAEGPVYNLVPPSGVAAELGARFNAFGTARIDAGVRSGSDYGIDADSVSITADEAIDHIEVTLWGVPGDEIHDPQRQCRGSGATGCSSGAPLLPFLTNPTSCSGPLSATLSADTWQEPGNFLSADAAMPAITGCERPGFSPTISLKPDVRSTESPSGLHVDLHLPQNQNPLGLAQANLKDTTVDLPDGLAVNPAGASGLSACSQTQIDLHGPDPASCPNAAKIGTVEVDTPLLDHPLFGAVYLATPNDNPFGSLLAIYIAVNDPRSGVVVKLAGEVRADAQTGRLAATFTENPQLPFEDFRLDFFAGPQAALLTPQSCGTYTTTSEMTPWTSPNGEDAHPLDSFQIDSGPQGSGCIQSPDYAPNAPSFSAGTLAPLAGAFSPLVLDLSRPDGSQRLAAIDTQLPPGLLGKLAGATECPDAALTAAARRGGAQELASPSCPLSSRLGTLDVAAGAGPQPYHVLGTVNLAGPYKGAPLSLATITPALAGPFDLGVVVVRAALNLDPATAQIDAVSDPLPTILDGIPLDLRSVTLKLDRPGFTLNPTNCDPMAITGSAISVLNQRAPLSAPFRVGGCRALSFKPRLSLTLKGKTKRTSHPTLIADLTAKPGEANIARAQVKLPKAAFLDQGHIATVCTRVQFAAHNCPATSIYGRVSATTPLLDYKLTGNVYLRSSTHQLPDLVADLNGPASQPIEIALAGRTDSVKGALRNTFEAVPDAPVTSFQLELFGGKRGLVILSSGLCEHPNATVHLDGQNGKSYDTRPVVKTRCPKGHRKNPGPPRQDRRSPLSPAP